MPTRNLAIMFTDIKGFTARTSESTREGMVQLLAEHDRLLTPVFKRFRGTVIKTIGDAFLVSFESPTDAVLCGMTVQEVLRQYNATAPERDRLDVRVAVNIGDVEIVKGEHGNDVFGEAVNLAARLEGIAEAGEVTFTEAVFLTMNRSEVPTAEIGEHTFKGIPKAVKVFRVVYDPNSDQSRQIAETVRMTPAGPKFDGDPRTGSGKALKTRRSPYLALGAALAIAVVLTVVYVMSPARRDAAAEATADALIAQGRFGDAAAATGARLLGREGTPALRALDTRARIRESFSKKRDVGDVQRIGREQMERWPADGAVPFEVVETLRGDYSMVSWIWFLKQAYERGHLASPEVRDSLLATLATTDPMDGGTADELRALALKHHTKETLAWAGTALEGTKAVAFLSAQKVLEEHGDARAIEPHVVDLRDLMRGERMADAQTRLMTEPPDRRTHAMSLLNDAADTLTFRERNRVEVVAAAEALGFGDRISR